MLVLECILLRWNTWVQSPEVLVFRSRDSDGALDALCVPTMADRWSELAALLQSSLEEGAQRRLRAKLPDMPSAAGPSLTGLPPAWLSPEAGMEILHRSFSALASQIPPSHISGPGDPPLLRDGWQFVECDDAPRPLPGPDHQCAIATARTVVAWVATPEGPPHELSQSLTWPNRPPQEAPEGPRLEVRWAGVREMLAAAHRYRLPILANFPIEHYSPEPLFGILQRHSLPDREPQRPISCLAPLAPTVAPFLRVGGPVRGGRRPHRAAGPRGRGGGNVPPPGTGRQ